jgi:hypothetical protein
VSIDVIGDAAAGPFAAACALLAFAGASKIGRPVATRPAATALGLPDSPLAVRVLGAGEVGAAVAGLAIGGAAAAVVAIFYAALAIAAWRLLTSSPGTACGCLGASDAPATPMHVVINIAALIAAALAATAGPPLHAAGRDLWSRVAFVVLAGCCAWLVASIVDALPALHSAMRGGSAS